MMSCMDKVDSGSGNSFSNESFCAGFKNPDFCNEFNVLLYFYTY